MPRPFLIGVTGGTASGKTTLCHDLFNSLKVIDDCVLMSMDNFYRGLTPEEHDNVANYNFDHPDALDFDKMRECLESLLNQEDTEIPTYDFASHQRTDKTVTLKKSNFIFFEGILGFYDPKIRDLMDFKIYVTADDDTRLSRRCKPFVPNMQCTETSPKEEEQQRESSTNTTRLSSLHSMSSLNQ